MSLNVPWTCCCVGSRLTTPGRSSKCSNQLLGAKRQSLELKLGGVLESVGDLGH